MSSGTEAHPVVSVLIPFRNSGRWLAETLASVQAQSYQEWEVIGLDDGSTDRSADVFRRWAMECPPDRTGLPRARLISRPGRGLVASRNELLAAARGEFVAWLDSDDLMPPRRLEAQVERLRAEPEVLSLGGACTLIDPAGRALCTFGFPESHEAFAQAAEPNIPSLSALTMRREAVLEAGGFRDFFPIAEDLDLCLRLAERGRVENLREVVLLYRQHLGSTCSTGRRVGPYYAEKARAFARERRVRPDGRDALQRGEPVAAPEFVPAGAPHAVETHRRWAWWALGAGNRATARHYAWRAVRESPLDRESWRLLACALRGR